LNRWTRRCRYALVTSIYAPQGSIDIHTPVAVQVGVPTQVEIPIARIG
jgi:hypothetical protein